MIIIKIAEREVGKADKYIFVGINLNTEIVDNITSNGLGGIQLQRVCTGSNETGGSDKWICHAQ